MRAKLLIATLALGALPLLIALLILPVQVQSTITRQGHEHLVQVARDLAALTRHEMQRHLETATNLARVELLRDAVLAQHAGRLGSAELHAANRQARSLIQGLTANHYQGIFLCSADGYCFAGATQSGDTTVYEHLDVRDRAYFSQARDTRQPVVSDPLISKIDNVPIVAVVMPVVDAHGVFAGLIGVSVELKPLAALIGEARLGVTGYPFAVDRNGILVVHPASGQQFTLNLAQVSGAETLAARMIRGESGVQTYLSSKGRLKLAAFVSEPLSGWSLAVAMEESEFSGPAHRIRLIILALIAACVIAAVLVASAAAVGLDTLNHTLATVRAREEKLSEQAALLDQTNDGIIVCDLSHHVQFWNQGAERLYGWTAAEAVGRRLPELLRINEPQQQAALEQLFSCGLWFGQVEKTTRTGTALTVDSRWTLLRDAAGHPRSILKTDTDITERRQMEAKLLRTQRLESIGTLAGGIAHDLNNQLSPIVIGLDLLRSSPRPPEDAKIFGWMEQSAARAKELIRQVLSFARGTAGARVSVHLGYVVREVEGMIRSTFPRNITVRVDCPKDIWLVHADPTQLNQVLLNLCVNARDAMPDGGQLTVSTRNVRCDAQFARLHPQLAPGAYVLLEVADTGTGIPRGIIDKIFDPFFTTKAPGQGTGLGLSTVLGLVRDHAGTINVYSEPGKGSVFKIHLPAVVDTTAPLHSTPLPEPASGGHRELILLVDDEQTILDVTQQALMFAGYRVLTATDGAQAFALYHRYRDRVALVLTDMMMPVMDGAALIAALRRIDPQICIIAASGLNDNNNQIRAAETGIRHFLCKPYTVASLLAAIKRALEERPSPPDSTGRS